jgi:RNA polymerase sigma factor (sigma-70 family)
MGVPGKEPAVSGLGLDEIERIYRADARAFERVAIAITSDENLGLDAVNEAFARAIRGRARFRRNAPPVAWVWRIVINEARRRAVAVEPGRGDELAAAANLAVPERSTADRTLIRERIARLPERQRLVLFLRYYADLDYAGIAAALDVSVGAVAATLNAAHQRLAPQLEEVRSCSP